MTQYTPTPRTTLKRIPERARYDHAVVHGILDEGLLCHVGFAVDGQPFVIPTSYGRVGERLYLHGSAASRMVRRLKEGIPCCVTVSLLDGLVLARSAFHHSMNYRSVVVFGTAHEVTDPEEKAVALRAIVEHIVPGRWDELRPVTENENRGTSVLSLDLEEVSAKVRVGQPVDDEEDYEWPVWAGVVPYRLTAEAPISDPRLKPGVEVPDYATAYRRPTVEME